MSPAPLSPAPPLYSLFSNVPRNNFPTSKGGSAWVSSTETTQPHWPSLPSCSSTNPVPPYPNSAPPFAPTCTVINSIYPDLPSTICTSSITSASGVSETTSGDSQTASGMSFSISSPASSSCCAGSTTSALGVSQTSTGPSSIISPTAISANHTVTTKVCAGINEDVDISGIGVRITFYVTNFLTVVGSLLDRFEPEGPFWATWFTSTALLFSAAAESDKHNLSLYNAIIVSYLCYLHCASAVSLLTVKMLCGDRKYALRYIPFTLLQIIGFLIYCLYIWSRAATFGNQPECNADTKFVFFFKNFSAVHQGPHIAIREFMFPLLSSSLVNVRPSPAILSALFVWQLLELGNYVYGAATGALLFDEIATDWVDAVRSVVFLYIPLWVYVVVTTELTIQRNWVIPNPPKFSFGQIFPLFTIGIPVVAIVLALLPEDWLWPWFRRHLRHLGEWTHDVIVYVEQAGDVIYHGFFVRSQPTDQATATQRLIEEPSVARIEDVNDADSG
ncbi:hypothetical protein K443DRAFT_12310 [Laccaria amethystina LaAM-08-1]|uniref:Uncharacterized protein n=1 Tax=Laccaria amethystina LaAM-08-1 TaxID=1095629 RepID=A0A0C9WYW4_9AGAR|nr:hypothetical protein K443DRAFT_12310 [Laccaria amethystina LaAM-08-1]